MSASPPMPVPTTGLSSTTSNLRARVLYNFTGSTANEMNLVAGQIIEVVRRGPAGGWSKGLTGAFPADFVEYLPAAPLFQSNPVTASATSGSASSLLDFGFATGTATGVQPSAGSMSQSTGFTSKHLSSTLQGNSNVTYIRSASSRTKNRMQSRRIHPLSMRSTNLPGVATRMSAPLCSSRFWLSKLVPP
jgi:hypothetical protein